MWLFINGCSCCSLLSVCGFTIAGTECAFFTLSVLSVSLISFSSCLLSLFSRSPFLPKSLFLEMNMVSFSQKGSLSFLLSMFLMQRWGVRSTFFSSTTIDPLVSKYFIQEISWILQEAQPNCFFLNATYGMLNYYIVALISVDSFSELVHSSLSYH